MCNVPTCGQKLQKLASTKVAFKAVYEIGINWEKEHKEERVNKIKQLLNTRYMPKSTSSQMCLDFRRHQHLT